ncbi:MAG: hypothetical protein KF861_16725 [Planctomycetaceae bacterium]|nr:hypothetical protein [Planctomycetaceae bacterium]
MLTRSFSLFAWSVVFAVFAIAATDGICADKSVSRPATEEETQRVRELIYILRQHRIFARTDEWAAAIRELVTIGKPAVPELIAELDATDRDETLRGIAFTLRAIDDPRAAPGLIRAVPKTLRPPSSDCGVSVQDPELLAFMLQHDRRESDREYFAYGRPVNEVLDAIQRIIGHREPPAGNEDPLRHITLKGDDRHQAWQRSQFSERQAHWKDWWADHWQEFVTQDELDSVAVPVRDVDLVEAAGVARFGPLFPTGADVRLGPVIDVDLPSGDCWDAKSNMDLDTGFLYECLEGIERENDPQATGRFNWYRTRGVDVHYQGLFGGCDLHLWRIENYRWDTIDDEVASVHSLELGREVEGFYLFDDDEEGLNQDRVATFLFTTAEGSKGILQVLSHTESPPSQQFRYRLWVRDGVPQPVAAVPAPDSRQRPVTRSVLTFRTITLSLPGKGNEFLLDLNTGRVQSPPDNAIPAAMSPSSPFYGEATISEWCRDKGIAISSCQRSVDDLNGGEIGIGLKGLDMKAAIVSPDAFLLFSLDDIREIIGRSMPPLLWRASMTPRRNGRPDPKRLETFAFQTKDGRCGMLQLLEASGDPPTITFRYRMFDPE